MYYLVILKIRYAIAKLILSGDIASIAAISGLYFTKEVESGTMK